MIRVLIRTAKLASISLIIVTEIGNFARSSSTLIFRLPGHKHLTVKKILSKLKTDAVTLILLKWQLPVNADPALFLLKNNGSPRGIRSQLQ